MGFFPLPELAEQAGFRPCKRCRPGEAGPLDPQVEQARRVCRHIERHLDDDLTLEALGREFNTSPHHLQRTFKHIVGVSPHQYVETCRMGQLRALLR